MTASEAEKKVKERVGIKDARKRAWETRRKKYGPHGHSGAYRTPKPIYLFPWHSRMRSMQDMLIRLYRQGVLSEGQVSRAIGMDRVSCREQAAEQRRIEIENCPHQLETRSHTDVNGAGVHREYWLQCTKCGETFSPEDPDAAQRMEAE